mgnify:CR=1 FL=1
MMLLTFSVKSISERRQTTPKTIRPLPTASTTSSSGVNVSPLTSVQHMTTRPSTITSIFYTFSRYLSTQKTNNDKKQRQSTVEQTRSINNKTISTTVNIISSPDGESAGVRTSKQHTKTVSVSPIENNTTFAQPTSSSVPDQATIISSISKTILTATPLALSSQQIQSTVLGETKAARIKDMQSNQIDRTSLSSE